MTQLSYLKTLLIVFLIFGFVNGQAETDIGGATGGDTNAFDDIDWATFDFGSFNF
jgi:hypothetical protein